MAYKKPELIGVDQAPQDIQTWISIMSEYVEQYDPGLSADANANSSWNKCSSVVYKHTFAQSSNVTNRKYRLGISIVFHLEPDNQNSFLLGAGDHKLKANTTIESIYINAVEGGCKVYYKMTRMLSPEEVDLYKPTT